MESRDYCLLLEFLLRITNHRVFCDSMAIAVTVAEQQHIDNTDYNYVSYKRDIIDIVIKVNSVNEYINASCAQTRFTKFAITITSTA